MPTTPTLINLSQCYRLRPGDVEVFNGRLIQFFGVNEASPDFGRLATLERHFRNSTESTQKRLLNWISEKRWRAFSCSWRTIFYCMKNEWRWHPEIHKVLRKSIRKFSFVAFFCSLDRLIFISQIALRIDGRGNFLPTWLFSPFIFFLEEGKKKRPSYW